VVPPIESLRSRTPFTDSRSPRDAGRRTDFPAAPPDFTPEPLTQPLSITEEPDVTASDTWVDCVVFDDPGFGHEHGLGAGESLDVTPAEPTLPPSAADAFIDSPESCLAQAQEAARTAGSLEELRAVADVCRRGLSLDPPAEQRAALARLGAWAQNRCGEVCADEGRQQEALGCFQTAVELDPQCAMAIHNRAVTLAEQNQLEEALRDFNQVIELNPRSGLAHRNRAELLATLGRMDEAAADYTHAIQDQPKDAELYAARGYAWQRLADFPRAEADLDHALQLSPENPNYLTQRGNLFAQGGNFPRAIVEFDHALGIEPNWTEAHRSLAWLYATCPNQRYRDPERALAAAERAAALASPDDYLVFDALAAAQASAGDFVSAIESQQRALAAAPTDLVEPLRTRLDLYRQAKPFVSGQVDRVASRQQQPAAPRRNTRARAR
jgi:tetratricopeptide (TPR) repeat protein